MVKYHRVFFSILLKTSLTWQRFNAKMFKLNNSQFCLKQFLDEIKFLFEFQWVEKGLNLQIVCNQNLAEESIVSDSKRIKQVLINLLSNSLKFTEAGTISVKVIKLRQNSDSYLQFCVKDTGVGINQNDIPMLFK